MKTTTEIVEKASEIMRALRGWTYGEIMDVIDELEQKCRKQCKKR